MKKNKGFTLVEILIVVALFSIVVAVAVSSLFSVLLRSKKTEAVKLVEHNGNYALRMLEYMIRPARLISAAPTCQTNMQSLEVQDNTGKVTGFAFARIGDDDSCLASYTGGLSGTENCLTDPQVEVVTTQPHNFHCFPGGLGYPPRIEIEFTLQRRNPADLQQEEIASLNFKTQISLRNY